MEKKDSSLIIKNSGDATHVVKKEHIFLVAELDSNDVGHFTPTVEKLKTVLRDSRIFEGFGETLCFEGL